MTYNKSFVHNNNNKIIEYIKKCKKIYILQTLLLFVDTNISISLLLLLYWLNVSFIREIVIIIEITQNKRVDNGSIHNKTGNKNERKEENNPPMAMIKSAIVWIHDVSKLMDLFFIFLVWFGFKIIVKDKLAMIATILNKNQIFELIKTGSIKREISSFIK